MPSKTSTDTQAVLLLMSRFSTRDDSAPDPLTQSEYNRLALALKDADLRPCDLLSETHRPDVRSMDHGIEPSRLDYLLQRSMVVGIQAERWESAGIWVLSRADSEYPSRLRERLRSRAPALLFGAGERKLLEAGGLAIVGSRAVDDAGHLFTEEAARNAAAMGIQVVSGGARGVDSIAMNAALARGGSVVGVLANDLAKTSRAIVSQEAIAEGRLCLVSPFQPESRFEAWKAMDRNKTIYALSDWALVVASDYRKGGTWAGAKENLSNAWVPTLVRKANDSPLGNAKLAEMGASPIEVGDLARLGVVLSEVSAPSPDVKTKPEEDSPQLTLFVDTEASAVDSDTAFKVTAWSNGSWSDTGSGLGIKLTAEDRDRYFDRGWDSVEVILPDGTTTSVRTNKASFWSGSCRELINRDIGRWLLAEGLAPWPKGQPPKLWLEQRSGPSFKLTS